MKHTLHIVVAIAFSLLLCPLSYGAEELTPEDPEYVEAIRPSAESGAAWAQALLGGFYYLGKHVEQDYTEARKWLELAAAQGEPQAMFARGGMHEFGHGVEKNIEKAFTFYQKAAEGGFASAQRRIGAMYH